jgi:hypothetical protein
LSIPSTSIGIESIKKWVDYWRKFKGKKVRVWFMGKAGSSISHQRSCWSLEQVNKEVQRRLKHDKDVQYQKMLFGSMRVLEACSCVEGEISDIVDSPFGLLLVNINYWNILQPERKSEFDLTYREVNPEISQMFVPMSEIARIDFLYMPESKDQTR